MRPTKPSSAEPLAPKAVDEAAADTDSADAMARRYAARTATAGRYAYTRRDVWQTVHERQRAMLALFESLGWADLGALRAIEVGCGSGSNLLELLRMGFAPQHLTGIEMQPRRLAEARHGLPAAVTLIEADARHVPQPVDAADLVLVATVFSSVLAPQAQQELADALWRWVRPGGGVLCYDFCVDNPRNPDVRGLPVARVRALFPRASAIRVRRLTLAPPLARWACRLSPRCYPLLSAIPGLRTHALVWLQKGPEP